MSFGNHMSEIVPPATFKKLAPDNPVKNRKMQRTAILLAKATGKLNKKKKPNEIKYIGRRPYNSERGAVHKGANASPKTKRDNVRIATSSDTPRSLSIPSKDVEMTDDAHVTHKQQLQITARIRLFFQMLKFNGFA